jgi:hypothetical protein
VEVKFDKSAAQEANYRLSFEKIRRRVGFVARRSLVEGILEILLAAAPIAPATAAAVVAG